VFTAVSEHGYARRLARVFVGTDRLNGLKSLSKKLESSILSSPMVYVDHKDNHLSEGVYLSSQSSKLYKMAMAFSLAYPYGIPKVMSSYNFKKFPNGPPTNAAGEQMSPQFDTTETCDNGYMCEQRWRQIANMVEFRHIVGDEPIENWWDNNKNQVVFSRGKKGFIAINMEGHDLEDAFQTGLPKGTYCDIITGVNYGMCTGLKVKVDANGFGLILLPAISRDGVLAIHIGNTVSKRM
jgi:alpha-amylase